MLINSIYQMEPVAYAFSAIQPFTNIPLSILCFFLLIINKFVSLKQIQQIIKYIIISLALSIMLIFLKIDLYWYGIAYFVSFMLGKFMLSKHIIHIDTLVNYVVLGTVLGGKIGYMLIYDFSLARGGMSFHGGLVGSIVSVWLFCRYYNVSGKMLAAHITQFTPIGLALGRIANAINNEIPGKMWNGAWAVADKNSMILRHPVSIYQAIAEGLVLWFGMRLWAFRSKNCNIFGNTFLEAFVVQYGVLRFITEHFKEDMFIMLNHKLLILSIMAGFGLACVAVILMRILMSISKHMQLLMQILFQVPFLAYITYYQKLTVGQILSLLMIIIGCLSFILRIRSDQANHLNSRVHSD